MYTKNCQFVVIGKPEWQVHKASHWQQATTEITCCDHSLHMLIVTFNHLNVSIVATSPLALCGMCDSPQTGCVQRTTPIYTWREQAIIEWLWRVISGDTNGVNDWMQQLAYAKSDHGMWSLLLLASHSVKFCTLAAQAFR